MLVFPFSVIIVVVICLLRQCGGKPEDKEPFDDDPDDDIRENIMYYDEEGAGRFLDHRTRVDKAPFWPKILRKVPKHYCLNFFYLQLKASMVEYKKHVSEFGVGPRVVGYRNFNSNLQK